jgi:hypothetical protein
MAIDTALKRASVINLSSPWRGILPLPDGVMDQADRQVVALMYSGISSAVAEESEGGGEWIHIPAKRRGIMRRWGR